MKTFIPFCLEPKQKIWYLIDAKNKTLGRLSTEISYLLQGKNKINFNNSTDTGNFVVIINSSKIIVSGNKDKQKLYYKHSGRPGGMKIETFKNLKSKKSEIILEKSIRKMLPKTSLGRIMFTRLKIFKNSQTNSKIKNIKLFKYE
jgi:large subunit ribosomal protein L13